MNLRGIMPSLKKPTSKGCMFPLCNSLKMTVMEIENKIMISRGQDGGSRGHRFDGGSLLSWLW